MKYQSLFVAALVAISAEAVNLKNQEYYGGASSYYGGGDGPPQE